MPSRIASITRPREKLLTYYILQALASLVAFVILMPVLYFRYHTMRYRFDEHGIRKSWGRIFRHEIMLNYERIQDIHLKSNVVERWLGLARIEVQTASGGSGAEMTLEGLEDAEGMRDFLYSRMRGARQGPADPLAAALHEVAEELREIRRLVEQRRA